MLLGGYKVIAVASCCWMIQDSCLCVLDGCGSATAQLAGVKMLKDSIILSRKMCSFLASMEVKFLNALSFLNGVIIKI